MSIDHSAHNHHSMYNIEGSIKGPLSVITEKYIFNIIIFTRNR